MAESRREIEEEELRDILDIRNRNQAIDRPERTKPDHLHASQGPLSSIRAAIRRTRSNTQSDHGRDLRRPEITILSAEPLSSTAWFPGASGGFPTPPPIPASQTNWTGSITADPQPPPTYDQVIKEKTQEEHVAKPTAAPRRSTTIATQTDPVRDEDPASTGPECTAAPQPIAERNSAVKKLPKPQKPPRPSPPQPVQSSPTSGTSLPKPRERASTSTSTNSPGGPPSATAEQSPQEPSCPVPGAPNPSVTVHWDVPATPLSAAIDCPATAAAPSLAPSDSTPTQRPTPLPRTRSRPQPIAAEVKVQTLVRLSENGVGEGVTPGADTDEGSSGKYLQELLDAFCADDPCEPSADFVEQSDQSEDSGDEMSSIHSQRNIRARIQAFESQVEEGIEDLVQPPEPQPRNAHLKAPPIAAKPSLAPRPSFKSSDQPNVTNANSYRDTLNTMFNSLSPTPAARPVPPQKPVELSLSHPEPETPWPTKVAVLPPPRSSVLARAKSFLSQEEEASGAPRVPLGRPAREPLKPNPNLNLNNHNSAYTDAERASEKNYVDSPAPAPVSVKPQHNEGSLRRESLTRRPTTIRVPSQPSLYESQESPPALPTQKPVSVLSQSVGQKLNFVPRFPSQDSFFSAAPEPALPPRPQGGKVLPARPPPAKAGPGRPPPPRANSTGRAASFHSPSRGLQPQQPRQLSQRTRRTGPMLPPRPSPGHRLYNKYTLETPHGIASYDYNGSSTGELSIKKNEVLFILGQIDHQTLECQVGDRKGPVPESYVKVITPLSSYSAQPAPRPAQQGSSGPAGSRRDSRCGLQVQALHDFDPEGPGELALRIGDVVSMVEEVDSEWYKGTSRGSSGFFPVNYVKVLSNAPTPMNEKKAKPPPARVSGPRCVARFDFEGEQSDELSFSEGDIIQLKEYLGDDWVRGQLGAYTGIFPLNFVDVIEDLPPPPAQQKTLPAKIALPGMATSPISQRGAKLAKPIQASPPEAEWAVALYDFSGESEDDLSFQQGDRILVTQHLDADWCSGRLHGRDGVFPVAFVETSTGPSPSVATPKGRGAGGLRAKALFDFQSNCDEELSFQVGDIIMNLESIDGEWYLGELKGQRALVPKNYVQVLS